MSKETSDFILIKGAGICNVALHGKKEEQDPKIAKPCYPLFKGESETVHLVWLILVVSVVVVEATTPER